ncbi:MAG: radical SAM protein, partial [Candidatus Omnitrophota bacterium]
MMRTIRRLMRLVNAFTFGKGPVYAHYGITHRCNLYCRMCGVRESGDPLKELSLVEIRALARILRSSGVIYVSIGGGEPLLRDDLPEAIRAFSDNGITVRLLTNGTIVTGDRAKKLVSAGLRNVSVSLDTLDPEEQDSICGVKGAWDRIMDAIFIFSGLIPRRAGILLINTVVSPVNIAKLPGLVKFAEKKGWFVSFVPIEACKGSDMVFAESDHGIIDKSYDTLIGMKSGGSPIFNSSLFLEKSGQFLKHKKKNWECDAGRLYFSVNPAGGMSVCHAFGPECSLSEAGAVKLPRGQAFEARRSELIGGCRGCMRPYWAEVSFLFNDRRSFMEMA